MPAVTDRAFKDVFSQMKIKEFYLQSTVPLEKVILTVLIIVFNIF